MKKPRRKKDWEGRYVKLLRAITTYGGVIFAADEVMRVTRNFGGLALESVGFKCPTCERRFRHTIRKVSEDSVVLLPEDYKPEETEHA